MNSILDLKPSLTGDIRLDEPLRFHTGFRIGGPAKVMLIPRGIEDLRQAIAWAGKQGVPIQVIGNGTSIICDQAGYDGLIIKIVHVLNHISIKGVKVYAGAGATMTALNRQAINWGLTGLEDWWGISSSIGGWLIRMGLAKNPALDHLISEVYVMEPDGYITRWIEPSQLFFKYNDDQLKKIIVEVVFNLKVDSQKQISEKIAKRQAQWDFLTQTCLPLAGPVFLSSENDFTEFFVQEQVSGLNRGKVAFLGVGNGYMANLGGGDYQDVLLLLSALKKKLNSNLKFNLIDGLCFLN